MGPAGELRIFEDGLCYRDLDPRQRLEDCGQD